MKCVKCGANILTNDLVCPYCGFANEAGVAQHEHLKKLEDANEAYKKRVIEKSKASTLFRIYKFANLCLVVLFLIVLVITVIVDRKASSSHNIENSSKEAILGYYSEGDLLSLYLAMNDCDGYFVDDIPLEVKQCSLIYSEYLHMKTNYAKVMSEYEKKVAYDDFYLKKCVESACKVYTGQLSSIYKAENLTDKEKNMIEYMKNDAADILVGTFELPSSMLEDINLDEYYYYDPIVDYLLEVWCNGED